MKKPLICRVGPSFVLWVEADGRAWVLDPSTREWHRLPSLNGSWCGFVYGETECLELTEAFGDPAQLEAEESEGPELSVEQELGLAP